MSKAAGADTFRVSLGSLPDHLKMNSPNGWQAMSSAQDSPLARKLGAFVALSGEELSTLDRLHGRGD